MCVGIILTYIITNKDIILSISLYLIRIHYRKQRISYTKLEERNNSAVVF